MSEVLSWRQRMAGRNAAPAVDHPGLEWWRAARFGMFIHWGLYALPAGQWEGDPVPGIGEWIMHRRRIPADRYAELAPQFNPVEFDAAAWVALAAAAGMRYLVITAKHHDGFAMFRSPCCPYNIVAATPWGRDPMAELAEACAAAGIKLGFYYSQDQDWHDPDASGNGWDFEESAKDFRAYLQRKVKPQLTELLTQYGPIGLIWFDTPYTISAAESIELARYVHQLQPNCLVSGRIGNDVGDYGSLGDNQIPAGMVRGDNETPATLNDTWGFKSDDHNWKSVPTLVHLLIDLASKGVNYLLNVGPTALGQIPQPSADRLREMGHWVAANGAAIYSSAASPFPYAISGLRMTRSHRHLFLFLLEPPADGKLVIHGLRTSVEGVRMLATGATVAAQQSRIAGDIDRLELLLPSTDGELVPVVELDLAGETEVDEAVLQQPDGSVTLHAHTARIDRGPASELELLANGVTAGWFDRESTLTWQLKLHTAGTFEVEMVVYPNHGTERVPPHRLSLQLGDQQLETALQAPRLVTGTGTERRQYFPEYRVAFGRVEIERAGAHQAQLRAIQAVAAAEAPDGITFLNAVLRPV